MKYFRRAGLGLGYVVSVIFLCFVLVATYFWWGFLAKWLFWNHWKVTVIVILALALLYFAETILPRVFQRRRPRAQGWQGIDVDD